MWTKQKLAMVSFFACAVLLALAFTSFSVSFEVTMRGPFALSERESSFTYRKNNNTNNNNHGASLTLEKNETSCDCGGRQSNSSTTERKENQPPVVERANTLSSYDLIVAVYDENPTEYLKHLEDCCPARECRVWIYSGYSPGSKRSHSIAPRSHSPPASIEEWLRVETKYEKFAFSVNNSHGGGGEATGYLTHIYQHYHDDDLPSTLFFLHGHVTSWHQREKQCRKISERLERVKLMRDSKSEHDRSDRKIFWSVSDRHHATRCMSLRGWKGENMNAELRDQVYNNWEAWTGESRQPERIVFTCCGQFMTSKENIKARSHDFWAKLFFSLPLMDKEGPPYEYLWDTFLDEAGSIQRATC